jgi:transcriptional regulator with XRE-family HTH domain
MPYADPAARVRDIRTTAGYTVAELAELSGIPQHRVEAIEARRGGPVTLNEAARIARVFSILIDELVVSPRP